MAEEKKEQKEQKNAIDAFVNPFIFTKSAPEFTIQKESGKYLISSGQFVEKDKTISIKNGQDGIFIILPVKGRNDCLNAQIKSKKTGKYL